MNSFYTFLIRYRSGGTPSTSPSQGVCRTSGPLTEGPGPTSSLGSLPAPRVACRCSPVGFDRQQLERKKDLAVAKKREGGAEGI
jgi:hypothetical protein